MDKLESTSGVLFFQAVDSAVLNALELLEQRRALYGQKLRLVQSLLSYLP